MNEKTYKFHVNGMHCNACVLLTESELKELPEVTSVKASLKNLSIEVEGSFGDKPIELIAEDLSVVLKPHGYSLSVEKKYADKRWTEFKIAIPVAIGFAVLFVLLQKTGLVNLVNTESVGFGTAFFIGIIASVSTCMAVVGGLVLSVSASYDKKENPSSLSLHRAQPQILFHIGRIVAFFLLGGLIGMLGSAFTLNTFGTFILSVIIGLVMLILGINLLEVFHFAKKLQPSMPKFISNRAHNISKLNHSLTPVLLGVATFFLPCGFTQSMQIYTLGTDTFLDGGLTMLAFALGTFPALALLSFSSFSIQNNKHKGIFFKSAGLIVILFALFNIINSLVVIGLISPIFTF